MINTDLNRDLGDEEYGYLGPKVILIRTYIKVVEYDSTGKPKAVITVQNEEVSLPAMIAVGYPKYGLPDDCELKSSRVLFGNVLDQWGQSF